ncbi:UDP-N-acetylglucosamine 2-epimerase (non-hydrolyzing) [Gammaproteobacteria bacterium]|nr:UDP-N-acetylglucosamine 2-epimerase (non-hydrolyzing) [Gammaproteobacteria bacterium]
MKKIKVLTVVGTRPEIIRLSRVIPLLDKHTEHTLVHTGQNYDYELNEIFFNDLEIRRPDHFLNAAGNTPCETIANTISGLDKFLEDNTVDALLILGDTNSSLSVIPAKRRKIPIFHMEAGNRCFDDRVPEEINRRIVDHTADINLPYSTIARNYLIAEGLDPDRIIKTGSPMGEVLEYYREKIENSDVLKELAIKKDNYFLVSAHREENIDSEKQFARFIDTLNSLAKDFEMPVIVSTHPRTRNQLEKQSITTHELVRFLKPLAFTDYIKLQESARVTLSDSGTITEEASVLNFPALNLRETNERPEGMEEGSVMMVGMDKERIYQGISILESQLRGLERNLSIVEDYEISNVSEKVLRIIQSYTDYVNRVVWKKY